MTIHNGKHFGSITVNWGSMFSGKTEELLRELKRAGIGGKNYQLIKPSKDDRYSKVRVETHYGVGLEAIVVNNSNDILKIIDKKTHTVGIDEGQFFDENLIDVCQKLKRDYHIDVIVSGLDMKYNGEPFEVMMKLAAISDNSKKFHAVCVQCGKDAYISHRIINNDKDIVIGSEGVYIALCEKHHIEKTSTNK